MKIINPKNETCVQRVRIYFYFFEKKDWLPDEKPPLDDIVKKKNVEPEALRYFSKFMQKRLTRIADMMELWEFFKVERGI